MGAVPKTLPDLDGLDTGALKFLILALHRQTESDRVEIDNLQLLIAKLKQMHFGAKSERVERQIEQLQLRLEDLEMNRAAEAEEPPVAESATPEAPATPAPVRRRPKREPLPAHLPRETQTVARTTPIARSAAESSARGVRMFRRSWSLCPVISKSSGRCGRS